MSGIPTDTSVALQHAVVIVDDSEDDRYLLQTLLKKAGIAGAMLSFEDGRCAVDFLASQAGKSDPPAVMFLDINMPRMNGHEVLKWVRQQAWLKPMRIVVLSGSTLYADIKQAAELGADYYFEKYPAGETLRQLVAGDTVTRSGSLAQACAS